jgi:hypothetical protein
MRGSITIAVAVAALTMAFTAKADRLDFFTDFFRGSDVNEWCQNAKPMALAYTAGLADSASRTMWVLELMRPTSSDMDMEINKRSLMNSLIKHGETVATYCRPPDVSIGQVTEMFCKYLRDHTPEERENRPAILFNEAMTKAWPCP